MIWDVKSFKQGTVLTWRYGRVLASTPVIGLDILFDAAAASISLRSADNTLGVVAAMKIPMRRIFAVVSDPATNWLGSSASHCRFGRPCRINEL